MKKSFYAFAVCLFISLLLNIESIAQTQEKSIPKEETYDDLAPFPFDNKKPEEKKTIGQKVKDVIQKDQEAHEASEPKEKVSEDPIRFYEFEDITFADEEEKEKVKETHTSGDFKWVKEDNKSEDDYYKDVTFGDETETEEETIYDDHTYSPYKDSYYKSVDDEEAEKKKEETKRERPAKTVVIKDKDYYKQDYIYYYYNRKQKGNGEPGSYPEFSDEINKSKRKIKKRISENRNERENH